MSERTVEIEGLTLPVEVRLGRRPRRVATVVGGRLASVSPWHSVATEDGASYSIEIVPGSAWSLPVRDVSRWLDRARFHVALDLASRRDILGAARHALEAGRAEIATGLEAIARDDDDLDAAEKALDLIWCRWL